MIELTALLRTTGAVRTFTDDPVDDALLAQVLDDARFAPSGGNRQPWRVAVVGDPALRRRLAQLMQPVWDAYSARRRLGVTPFNVIDDRQPTEVVPTTNPLLDAIEHVPVVLAVAARLRDIAAIDVGLDRVPITPGASIYPFCWSVLLAARARDLGGVMTTFLSRVEPAAAPELGLPADHALAATIFLGHPEHQPTKLTRRPVGEFSTRDRFDGEPFPTA